MRPFATLVIATTLVSACDAGSGPPGAPPPPQVTVAEPLVKDVIEYDEYTGQFEAVERVEIRARVSGYLDRVDFQDGQLVEQGDLLYVIDQRPFQIALSSAQADQGRADAQVDLAERELARAQELRGRGNISQADVDRRTEELSAARGAQAKAAADVRQARLDLEFTEVKAPISGRISRTLITPGNVVDTSTVLTTLVSIDPIYFTFDISERAYLRYLRIIYSGARPSARREPLPVTVKLLDEDNFVHPGVLQFADNALSSDSGTLVARATMQNENGFLTPGQFGRLRFPANGPLPKTAVLVPDQAILADQSRRYVLLIGAENMPERRYVETGKIIEGLRQIRQGLDGSETIIIGGIQRVRPRAPVTPQPGQIETISAEPAP